MEISEENGVIKKRYNNIKKSVNDNRSYRGLILNNDMKVMLISDPTTQKSAATLNINIGVMNDPDELPGLANFCEHMLFFGSEKYSDKNEYVEYITEHNGYYNAQVDFDYTAYYFDVASEYLEGALDRLAQFFLSPLFNESVVESEVNNVHSEFETLLNDDDARIDQIVRSSIDPKHPYAKFFTGNKNTLIDKPKEMGINIRSELIKFYQRWYSSNLMALTVFGNQSLDELEEIVTKKFSEVINKNVQLPSLTDYAPNDESYMHKWYIVPVRNAQKLTILFPMPVLAYNDYYNSSPMEFFSALFNTEGKASLSSALKKQGLITEMITTSMEKHWGGTFSLLCINIKLTDTGLNNIDDIMVLIFQYIQMLRPNEHLESFFNECQQMEKMKFDFESKIEPIHYVLSVAHDLQLHPVENVLTKGERFSKWNPNVINSVLDNLVPQKVRIYITAKDFENIANETEQWYGTRYKKYKIPDTLVNKWTKPDVNLELKLPLKNEFIPTSFDIKAVAENDTIDEYPIIIKENSLIRVWFKQDDEFRLPKAGLALKIVSPFFVMDAVGINMTKLYVALCNDLLTDCSYYANIAGSKFRIESDQNGIEILIAGFDDKISILVNKIIDTMLNLSIDNDRFEYLKKQYNNELLDFEAYLPFAQGIHYQKVLINNNMLPLDNLSKSMSYVKIDGFKNFMKNFFERIHIECLIHGNLTKVEAQAIAKSLEDKLKNDPINKEKSRSFVPLSTRQLMLDRAVKLNDGCNFSYGIKNKISPESSIVVYYQTGLISTESDMLLALLNQIIAQQVFDILRTQEQLGYTVFSEITQSACEKGLSIIVQSEKHPKFLDERIEAFLESMKTFLMNMSESVFDNHISSLKNRLMEKPSSMSALLLNFKTEIFGRSYEFERNIIEVGCMEAITRQEIIQFFEEKFINKTSRRKVAVHVVSTITHKSGSESSDQPKSNDNRLSSMPTIITNIDEFKARQSLCPLPTDDY
ncbi:insulin-degrading enzyme-like [Microplitis mediator]|uniref:insulin-degrading enzyme-like n=1 Tax=Microplitis mediator TaxID=375433 RepID=UPI002552E2C7|nr:insulin-degrading enzyme-like [Microplitis mediator]